MLSEMKKLSCTSQIIILAVLAVALSCGLFLSSCTGDKVTATEVRLIIGPYGGTVWGPKGTKVVIPAGALKYETPIILSELPDEEIPENSKGDRISIALWMRPEGFVFQKPVTVEMPYQARTLTSQSQITDVKAFLSPRFFPAWDMRSGTSDVDQHIFRAETNEFGVIALFRVIDADEAGEGEGEGEGEGGELECICDEQGDYCLVEDESCQEVSRISLAVNDNEDSCSYGISFKSEQGEELLQFDMNSCPPVGNVPVIISGKDCLLNFDAEDSAFAIDCAECLNTYKTSACE